MKRKSKYGYCFCLVQIFTELAVGFYWVYYRNTAQLILSSEKLTLEVIEGLEESTINVALFQRIAIIPVRQFLGGYAIHLAIQIIIMCTFQRWGAKLKKPFITLLSEVLLIWVFAVVPLFCFMCQQQKLLLTSSASYIVPYVFSCVFIPALWLFVEIVSLKKCRREGLF